MALSSKKLLVGLTGGIACYKTPNLIRSLVKAGAEVRIIMTEAATKFITPLTMETVSGNPVAVEMFSPDRFVGTRHIDFGEWPDLIVVAPATANFLGKIANGISDDLLTTVVCASQCKVMIAPAMNPQMWHNPVTQKNLQYLQELGYPFVGPGEGDMACKHVGIGRMAEPDVIFEAINSFFDDIDDGKKKLLNGKKIVITAGPTREAIDPVRYISNHSSGKMGYALAAAAADAGAETILISGPTSLDPPPGVDFREFTTTAELHDKVISAMASADCLIMAAAPSDYRAAEPSDQKIKKNSNDLTLKLKPTVDILSSVSASRKNGQVLIGFALETENAIENARKKLCGKDVDMIVVNSPGKQTGFDHDTNEVTVLTRDADPVHLPLSSKTDIAVKILEKVASLL